VIMIDDREVSTPAAVRYCTPRSLVRRLRFENVGLAQSALPGWAHSGRIVWREYRSLMTDGFAAASHSRVRAAGREFRGHVCDDMPRHSRPAARTRENGLAAASRQS